MRKLSKKELERKVSIRQKIKKAFISTGKEVPIVINGKEYKVQQKFIDGVWKGLFFNDEIEGVIIDKEIVENLIEEDESILE